MDKLKQLTDRLYNEGLSKGKAEGETILAQAKKDAQKIIADAQAQAKSIVEKATQEAEGIKTKAASDVRMASEQCLQATKKDIENLVVAKLSSDQVKSACKEPDFLKSIITEVAKKFTSEQAGELSLVLPAALQAELEPWLKGEFAKQFGSKVEGSFSKKIAGGFNIGPKDGAYFVSLTDETFNALIAEYIRPVTRKLLFGE